MALDRRRGGHRGDTRCVRPPRPWRPSKLRLEVDAQRSPGARMSGFMPRHIEQPALRHSKPASLKISSRPSRLGLRARPAASRGRPSRSTRARDLVALDHLRGGAQVADAGVRARADEHAVELELADRRAGLEPHVDAASARRSRCCGCGHRVGDADDLARVRAPGDQRARSRRVDGDLAVERRAVVGGQRAPVRDAPPRSPPARPAGLRPTRTSCRRARSCPRGRRPRSTCCRSSSAAPSRARGSPRPRTRRRGRRRRWCRSGRSCRGSGPSP